MPRPAPTTAPFTAAIVPFGISASSRESSCPARCRSTRCSKVRPSLAAEPMVDTSPPAQNARPAPVTSTAPTSASSAQRRRWSMPAAIIASESAFSFSGRLSVSVATRSVSSKRRSSVSVAIARLLPGRHHPRRAYQWTVEVTVYVHQEHHRKGVGLGLYTSLLGCLALQGFRGAVGIIALPNPASVGLHERMGFAPAGVLRAVGYKHGRWHAVGWWQRALGEHDGSPEPPRPPAALQGSPEWRRSVEAGVALVRA